MENLEELASPAQPLEDNVGSGISDKSLQRNLDVVFLLRNLMKLPSNQLENNLKEFGENPENWISLCESCTRLTRQARKLHQKIMETEKELKSIQKLIISKTRSSSKGSCLAANYDISGEKLLHHNNEIWRRTRCFVKNYGYPFTLSYTQNQSTKLIVEGDKLANYLADQLRTTLTTKSSTILIPENLDSDNGESAPTEDNEEKVETIREKFNDDFRRHKKKKRPPSAYTSKREYKHYEMIDGKYKCRHCNELFFSGSTCYVHEREKHCANPGQYACDLCTRKFNSSAYLISHRRCVHKVKQDGGVRAKVLLKKVVTVEEGMPKKRHQCHLCPRNYAQKGNLTEHIRFDHEKKIREDMICKICPDGGKAWTSKKDLIIHQFARHKDSEEVKKMREEGVNVWICEVVGCTDRFITKEGLDNHRKIGGGCGGTKRFTCAFCGDGFGVGRIYEDTRQFTS